MILHTSGFSENGKSPLELVVEAEAGNAVESLRRFGAAAKPPPHDARSEWLKFVLIVTGSAVGGFCVSVLGCYAVGRIVAKSVQEHLRCLTVTPPG